jgi:hypothetical protein
LNLTTQRSYKLDEVRDLVNQALNARGFTSIQSGEVLSVFKIEKLDPSAVRQVDEEELYNRNRYDFVKVSFELPEDMEVDKAKDDVKQLLSPHAKVFPLVTTKRLLIMDSVANLRTVSELFNQERLIQSGRIVPEEFVLKHARPDQVIEVLKTMVGSDSAAKPPAMTPEQQQQHQQMVQQMQQQGRQPPKPPGATDAPKVYLAMNRRRNSVIVNAPPEQLKIIKQTIDYLDVPHGEAASAAGLPDNAERTLLKYPLITMDPEQLKITLEEIGELDPRTELRADTKSKILFARATTADHKKITALKDELDGSGRTLHVIWLPRNLPADAVAGTVMALMGGQEEKEDDDNDGYPFYFSYRSRNNDDDKPKKGFRVDADIENNRLLLWANDAEHQEVEQFLDELGRAAPGDATKSTVRSLEPSDPADTARLLEQLRTAWPALGDNELIINDERPKTETAPPAGKKPDEKSAETKDRAANASRSMHRAKLAGSTLNASPFRLVQQTTDAPPQEQAPPKITPPMADAPATKPAEPATEAELQAASEQPADAKPARRAPVTITVTKDGRILIASEDTAALDRLEHFIGEAAPPTQRYKIFRIKYANVFDVYLNLKEFYEDELSGEKEQILDWWGDVRESNKKDSSLLSKRPPLRLIWDPASDSILVANASSRQLTEIERLINEYDQPAPDDATTERVTQPVKIQYSRASTIAAAVKEVYRDLLSSKDKEFDSKEANKGGSSTGSGSGVTILSYSRNNSSSDGAKKSAPVKVGFQGALSLGADDVSNIVLVSAQKEVFDGVVEMIRQLDEEAAPKTTLHVHRLTGNIQAESLQKALDEAVGKTWLGNRPEQTGAQPQPEQKQDNDQDRDRGNRSERRRDRDND